MQPEIFSEHKATHRFGSDADEGGMLITSAKSTAAAES